MGGLCGIDTGGAELRVAENAALAATGSLASEGTSAGGAGDVGLGLGADVVTGAALGRSGRTGAVERAVGGVEDGEFETCGAVGVPLSMDGRGAGAVGRADGVDGVDGAAGRAGAVAPVGDAGRMLGG